ncbi:hypothetical protein KFL_004190108 [Klebsormidium nitens]|uniref:Uncharacterized protein n=1 Tax=Klebsormidium nitens TaxID=105231 RepID=A0A1Y1IH07_KLENI|nr:hypothetical protein KFL_004190108 [Klebsormidium nitens]|eukprot:GAQ88341.1 hypothetical protein KFL_004190108 [Klebsormidium nitens]
MECCRTTASIVASPPLSKAPTLPQRPALFLAPPPSSRAQFQPKTLVGGREKGDGGLAASGDGQVPRKANSRRPPDGIKRPRTEGAPSLMKEKELEQRGSWAEGGRAEPKIANGPEPLIPNKTYLTEIADSARHSHLVGTEKQPLLIGRPMESAA